MSNNQQMNNNQKFQVKGEVRKGTTLRLISYIFKYYPIQFVLVLLSIMISTSGSVVGSYFVGNVLIGQFVTPAQSDNATFIEMCNTPSKYNFLGLSFNTCIIILICYFILAIICTYVYNYLMSIISQGIQKRIRDSLFAHMQDLPISYFDSHTHGDIMSIYTNDVDALREMLARSVPMALSSFISMIACLIMMIITNIFLTLVVLLFAGLIFFITKYFAKMSSKYFIKQQIELGKTNGYIEEMTTGQKVVKVFNYEKRNITEFKKHNDELCKDSTTANRYASILMPTVNQLGNLQYAIVALIGGLMYVNNFNVGSITPLSIGTIISFLLYSKSFVQPIGQISMQLNTIALAIAGSSRIFEMIDTPSETDDGYVELVNAYADKDGNPVETSEVTNKWAWKHPHKEDGSVTYQWLTGKIDLYNVDFGYLPNKIVLHDISLYAKPGQKIAFVGPTGAGKTTITNLLNRFYDIADGKIRYDDININKIKKDSLRQSLGMVFQDTKLFTGTIKDNIRFGKLNATDEEIYAACKLANADSFIRLLPDGYDTVLTNGGASLSQGQRQLLSIARTAISNPPVLVLDEATSSIDSRTEKLVQEGMDNLMKGRTVFVIAHRLSTIKNSDAIMVLDHGHIIERGTHEELLNQKGKYYQLYTGNAITE